MNFPLSRSGSRRGLVLLAFGVSLAHLPLLSILPVSGDEAYYWQCAQHPAWSYFDQPPLVPWLMGLSTRIFGVNETAARLPAVAMGLASMLAVLWICRRFWGDEPSALVAVVGLLATPLFALGTMYTSTDLLLSLFVLVVPPLAAVTILEDRPRDWLLVGALGGLAGLAKFAAVLLLPVIAALLVFHPTGRRHLRRPEPWLGALLGLVALSPALIWAVRNNFDNIRFQLFDRHREVVALRALGEFLAPQMAMASPLLFPLLVTALVVETGRALRERDLATLSVALPADVYLGFFALAALRTSSQPHWGAPAYFGGAIVTARWCRRRWSDWSGGKRRYVAAALGLGLAASLGLSVLLAFLDRLPRGYFYPFDRARISTDAIDQIYGWHELVAHLQGLEAKGIDVRSDPLFCDSYTTASMIAFYSAGAIDPILIPYSPRRHGQGYLYWQRPEQYVGRRGIYVGRWNKESTKTAFRDLLGSPEEVETFTAMVSLPAGAPVRPGQSWRIVRGSRLGTNLAGLRPPGQSLRYRAESLR